MDFKTIVATNLETGQAQAVRVADVALGAHDNDGARARVQALDAVDEEGWKIAWQRLEAIRPLLESKRYARSDVDARAAEVGFTASTLYTWLGRYRGTRDLTALVPQQRGWTKGASRITAEAETVIAQAIKDVYLKKDRRRVVKVVQQVRSVCRKRGMTAPSEPTIRARVAKISEEEKMRKRGMAEEANRRFTQVRGNFPGADYPLAVLQIDHTMVDLVVVDDIHRLPIGRPWITVGIDVYSRMLPGVHLSFDSPCTASVARCVAQAVLPKEELLLRPRHRRRMAGVGLADDGAHGQRGRVPREHAARGMREAWGARRIPPRETTALRGAHRAPPRHADDGDPRPPGNHLLVGRGERRARPRQTRGADAVGVRALAHDARLQGLPPARAQDARDVAAESVGTRGVRNRHHTGRRHAGTAGKRRGHPARLPPEIRAHRAAHRRKRQRAGPTRRRCSSAGSGPKTRTTPGNRATSRSGEIRQT